MYERPLEVLLVRQAHPGYYQVFLIQDLRRMLHRKGFPKLFRDSRSCPTRPSNVKLGKGV